MKRRNAHLMIASALGALTLLSPAGCQQEQVIAPPDIRYGEDVCAECGMIISDDRYAAAAIYEIDERYETFVFDDVGCLYLFEPPTPDAPAARFVCNAAHPTWLDMRDAFFVYGRAIETPMAFGIAAYASREAAEQRAEEADGNLMTEAELDAWIETDPAALDPFGIHQTGSTTD